MSVEHTGNKDKIKGQLKKIGEKTIKSNNLFFTFLRSIVSSQCASWVDLGIGFALFSWLHFSPAFATALGAICGGVVNCIINYKFTFHADNVDWKAVIVKYAMIWIASILLNTFGTSIVYYLIEKWDWLETIGFRRDGYYAAARLFVSLMVSWFWNFPMQKYFVYSVTGFDKYAIKFFQAVKTLFVKKKREPGNDLKDIENGN